MSTDNILTIPSDVIIMVMHYLGVRDLATLACVCTSFHALVDEFGWKSYLRSHPRPSRSLSKSVSSWTPRTQVRINTTIDHHWSRAEFVARPLSNRWSGKLQPILAINSSRLLLAAGNSIYSYQFIPTADPDVAPSVRFEGVYSTSSTSHPEADITSLVCAPDGGLDRTLYVGYASGVLEKLILPPRKATHDPSTPIEVCLTARYGFHGEDIIESLSASSTHLLSLASSGIASLLPLFSQEDQIPPSMIDLKSRSWASYLSTRSSTPFAAFGTSSPIPLSIHHVLPTSLHSGPFALLAPSPNPKGLSAVYAIDSAPPSSPWGASDQIIVSGWFDGLVRVHDLRSSSRTTSSSSSSSNTGAMPSMLLPTLTFADPWSFEPIYSLSCGGGSAAHIAAGSARHSVVAFWDVRAPTSGWSVHAPGNDSSPVYSVIVDGPRVFGANQSRGFVLDFGVGVHEGTYPALSVDSPQEVRSGRHGRQRVDEGLKRTSQNGPGFYVTKYSHGPSASRDY